MKTLLAVSIGPVQDFIREARRSRDLWFGSHLLSELSREVAKAIAEAGGELIFPALEKGDLELKFCETPLRRESKKPPQNIANKILAEISAGIEAKEVAGKAREALLSRWRGIARGVWEENAEILVTTAEGRKAWEEQIETVLEFSAVWVPFGEGGYKEAREIAEAQMAARKNLRDFGAWEAQLGGRKKSSLDGQRESLLAEGKGKARRRKLRIGEKEELDAVGLIKRTAFDPEQFMPLANIAYAAWIDRLWQKEEGAQDELEAICREAGIKRLYRDTRFERRPRILGSFSYDAHIFSPSRWEQIFTEGRERADEAERKEIKKEAEAWGKEKIQPFLRKAKVEPTAYLACLVADGDRMGKLLDAVQTAQGHRILSKGLTAFAERARGVVEQLFRGSLIYAGGDDVMAFVCLEDAVDCATELHRVFGDSMAKAIQEVKKQTGEDLSRYQPTLSVGLGIGHVVESMGYLLDLGREAEKLAKGGALPEAEQRDALAVILDKRSGGKTSWRCRWQEGPSLILRGAMAVLQEKGGFSSKKVYEVQKLLQRMPKTRDVKDTASDTADWAFALQQDIRRTLERAKIDWRIEGRGEEAQIDRVDLGFPEASRGYAKTYQAAQEWIQRMLVARLLLNPEEPECPNESESQA